jgi:predicted P-loop ATPase/phage/plasmid primase-like uncharacterized protein
MTTLDQAVQQMQAHGLPQLPQGHPVADGKIRRFGPKKKCWYVLHEIRTRAGKYVHVGAFGIWGVLDSTKIEVDWAGISDQERHELTERMRSIEAREAEKRKRFAQLAATRARQQWKAGSIDGTSAYVQRKQITAPGLRYFSDGTVLIPMLDYAQEPPALVGLQKIAPDGTKRFNKGIAKAGSALLLGRVEPTDRIIAIAEGYATGRSCRMATDDTVPLYVAWDAYNLINVARMARARHPDAHLLFCADDDYLTEGNPGISRARAAAESVGNASVVSPRFLDRGSNKLTDFNDLHVSEGLERVKDQLTAAIFAALQPESVKKKVAEKLESDSTSNDELYDQAVALVLKNSSASISMLQRFLRIGYNRAARLVEEMEKNGIVGPLQDGGKREILHSRADGKPAKKRSTPQSAGAADGEPPPGPPPSEGEPLGDHEDRWEFGLARSEKGNILPSLSNVFLILDRHEEWLGVIAYDEFSGQVVKLKPPPFSGGEIGEWSDMDDLRCTLWMQQKYGFQPRKEVVMDAVLLIADLHKYHVVRAYLDPLEWDQVPRLDHWLIDKLGAADTEYNRVVARKWMIAAVARIYRPGCKADNVLILEGEQGLYKSTALKVLGGEWFTDAPFRLGDKDAYVVIRGKWIVELAELDSFNKAESTGAKLFFGQYIDRYRNFYGKRASDVPRQQVFAGTTNSDAYLKDDTGNRRYWPVLVTEIDLEGLKVWRDQLWAEAVAKFRAGEEWWPTSAERAMFEEQQDQRYVGDAYTQVIATWLVGRSQATMTEILGDALKLDVAKWTKPEQQRVGRCMSELGWKRKRETKGKKRDWIYMRPEGGDVQAGGDDGPL